MNGRKIYLCGAINACSDAECKDWRQRAIDYFPRSIDPMRRDYRGKEELAYREIVDLDKLDIRNCDAVLVYYLRPSVGTSMEILYAWSIGRPIIVVSPEDQRLSPWLIYHSTAIVKSMDEAAQKLAECFS